jgi:hypothetical protein
MTEQPKAAKGPKSYRDRAEAELRSARGALKGVGDGSPGTTVSLHLQAATTFALLDLADAIRRGTSATD